MGRTADVILSIGTPVAFCSLQFPLVWHLGDLAAVTTYALGVFYVGLGYFFHYRFGRLDARPSQVPEWYRRLVKICLIMGAFFGNLAMPLSLPVEGVALAWGAEGLFALVWGGLKGNRIVFRVGAVVTAASFAALQYILRWNELYLLCLPDGVAVVFAGIS
ncbi:MAG: hypothetical protein LBS00_08265 [Synergistaceae bacterium]|jgi:hypothetical protein|nr:hypothetical protein [Synergistaceae bacterium]